MENKKSLLLDCNSITTQLEKKKMCAGTLDCRKLSQLYSEIQKVHDVE